MKTNFLLFFIVSLSWLLCSCSNDDEYSNSSSDQAFSQSSVISGSQFLQNVTLAKLQLINDSICSSPNDEAVDLLKSEGHESSAIFIADTQGFYDGVRYGWSSGKGWGKIGNAVFFGSIFAAAYSAVAFVFEGISAIVDYFIDQKAAIRAASNVYSPDKLPALRSSCRNTLEKYKIRYSQSELDFLEYSYAHNEILAHMEKNSDSNVIVLDSVFSQDQILILKSEDFRNNFNDIENRVGNLSLDFVEEKYSYETKIFSLYLKGLSSIKSTEFKDCLSKVCDLRKEYSSVIMNDSSLSEDHKDGLIAAFGVAPFSLVYWNNQIGLYEK